MAMGGRCGEWGGTARVGEAESETAVAALLVLVAVCRGTHAAREIAAAVS